MRTFPMVALLLLSAAAHAGGAPFSCELGNARDKRAVVVTAQDAESGAATYYLRYGGKPVQPAIRDIEHSRGLDARLSCVGRKRRAMLLFGEFGAGYPHGVVLSYNPATAAFERIDFAERALPSRIYLGERGSLVVIPTGGRGETDARYVVYRYAAGKGQDEESEATDELPATAGYTVIALDR
ncbi:hypothetical protein [Lysobacter sp. yr284]|uniref:hypothetical protein n=1 Tax=Lysobacter sp. yr284 TaxID=1761791 RepID=UPI0011140F04|nr:hypothetical protein [Lysobacter sp. yr284]